MTNEAAFFSLNRDKTSPEITVIAPVYNEAENVIPLLREIDAALSPNLDYEVIFVDDCSQDGTADVLAAEKSNFPRLRVLSHGNNAGQSRAIRSGVLAAKSSVIATLDGDGQNDPADIPALYRRLVEADPAEHLAMVSGERVKRQDNAAKLFASQIANGVRMRVLKDGAKDSGCSLKIFYREAFLRLPFFDHVHRYLPALVQREGFGIAFLQVNHRPRLHGSSKYDNFKRLIVAFRDMLGVIWLNKRSKSPKNIVEK